MLNDPGGSSSVELQRARLLEKQGQQRAAAEVYLKLGALLDAARVLTQIQRFSEAGQLVLRSLGPLSAESLANDPARRKLALTAARLLARGGQTATATKLHQMLGQPGPGGEVPKSASGPIPLTQRVESPEPKPTFMPGNTIAERYRLESTLGRGGLGVVFRATDLELGEPVALKIFAQPTQDETAIENFRQELKLARQLTHPNVIRLFDIGIHQGHRFISMELLVGQDLKAVLGRQLNFATGLDYLAQACQGLQAAHELGIIHRDIKPENLFITQQGVLKVMDFGIARQRTGGGVTFGDGCAGTPDYISPEQINEFSSVGPSADLYSLGAVAYEIFTGAPPFSAPDLTGLLKAHLMEPPVPPSRRNPDIPRELEEVLLKLLEKAPSRRFLSCRELAAALEPIRQRYAVEDFF